MQNSQETFNESPNARYVLVRHLAQGGYGTVSLCFDNVSNTWVAIKHIATNTLKREAVRESRELHIMRHFSHPQIISLLDVYTEPARPQNKQDFSLNVVMPAMNGDLRAHIRDRHLLPCCRDDVSFLNRTAVVIAFQVIFAMDHLHQSNVIHRDLKPENILVTIDILDPTITQAVLADFGLARYVTTEHQTQYVCSRNYRPPEAVTMTSSADPQFDIWSLGCLIFELLTGTPLFSVRSSRNTEGHLDPILASRQLETILDVIGTVSAEDIAQIRFDNVKSYLRKTEPRTRTLEAKLQNSFAFPVPQDEMNMWIDMVSSCVQFNPAKRPTAMQLACSPLFAKHGIVYGQNVVQEAPNMYIPLADPGTETPQGALEAIRQMVGSMSPTVNQVEQVYFPQVNESLTAKYSRWDLSTSESVQAGIAAVLDDMAAAAMSDPSLSHQLQLVLNFFIALRPVEAPGDTDGMLKVRLEQDF